VVGDGTSLPLSATNGGVSSGTVATPGPQGTSGPSATPLLFGSPVPPPKPDVDDPVSRAVFRRRVLDTVDTALADNSPEVFMKAVATLEMVLGNIVKNPTVPRCASSGPGCVMNWGVGSPWVWMCSTPWAGH
jgi:hypothetical protein